MEDFVIRKTRKEDLPRLLEIYEKARVFMAETGNPYQWGKNSWPPDDLVEEDIREGRTWAVEACGKVHGVFACFYGKRIDPSYGVIDSGEWKYECAYAVIHRIASSGEIKGVAHAVLSWALERYGCVRIDTHPDNRVMRNLLAKEGFSYAGRIHVPQDTDWRYAYEKKIQRLELYRPAKEELYIRRDYLADPLTMAYNHSYGGTVDFPESRWEEWHGRWVENTDGKRFFRYLRKKSGNIIGEAAYRLDENDGRFYADIIVAEKYRGRGFGREGLALLCSEAKKNGIDVLWDSIAEDNPAGIGLFLSEGFEEVSRDFGAVLVRKKL